MNKKIFGVCLCVAGFYILFLAGIQPARAAFFRFDWEKEGATIHENTEIAPLRIYPGQSIYFKRRLQVDAQGVAVERVVYRMGVPYLPDFDGIVSWTPLRFSEIDGFVSDPDIGNVVSFRGPLSPHPFSFYTEADYEWDYSALGVWQPGFQIGDDFQLRSTPQARSGVYYLRFNLSFDAVNLPKFEGAKEYKPEQVILKRQGAVTPRITVTNTGAVPIASMAILDEIYDGWAAPKNLQGVTVLVTDIYGTEWTLAKSDYSIGVTPDGLLQVVVNDFKRTAFGADLRKNQSLYVKYPLNFNRAAARHVYSGKTFVTAVSPAGAFTKASFTTGLIVKE
ncbi:hypothetical protein HY522_10540 [bacterium]|nr:hypothetical protein [bacterium]